MIWSATSYLYQEREQWHPPLLVTLKQYGDIYCKRLSAFLSELGLYLSGYDLNTQLILRW